MEMQVLLWQFPSLAEKNVSPTNSMRLLLFRIHVVGRIKVADF